jgi:GT2 family glycosyltransferase
MTIDLCVVNYKTPKHLNRFLESLTGSRRQRDWNLFIADNGGDDESLAVIDAYKDEIAHVDLNENIGYSAACNLLASHGKAKYLALLNADVWMRDEHLEAIEAIMDADETIAILGPKQRNERGEIVHGGIVGSNTRPVHRGWRKSDQEDILFKDQIDCVTVSGSAYFVRRDVWEELGNDPEYKDLFPDALGPFLPTPHYYEETFCSYFARHRGYRVVYDGTVTLGHTWHASSDVGGGADKLFKVSQSLFREACSRLGIETD